jgi:hypothetical protein
MAPTDEDPCSGDYLSNGLHGTYLRDRMPLDHWFHAFQVTFGEMVVAGPEIVTQALAESTANSLVYDYPAALTVYAECRVRSLNHGNSGGPCASVH